MKRICSLAARYCKLLAAVGLLVCLSITLAGVMRLTTYSLPMWRGDFQQAGTPRTMPNLLDPPDAPRSPLEEVDHGWFDRAALSVITTWWRTEDLVSGSRCLPMYNVGLKRYEEAQYSSARHAFEKAYAACSDANGVVPEGNKNFASDCQLLIGNAFANEGKTDEAVAAYTLSLRHNPNNIFATYNLEKLQDAKKGGGGNDDKGDKPKPAGPVKRI
jgi:tetratricopeptide (TPR) repeat protein